MTESPPRCCSDFRVNSGYSHHCPESVNSEPPLGAPRSSAPLTSLMPSSATRRSAAGSPLALAPVPSLVSVEQSRSDGKLPPSAGAVGVPSPAPALSSSLVASPSTAEPPVCLCCSQQSDEALPPLFTRVAVRSVNLASANAEVDDGVPASILREASLLQEIHRQQVHLERARQEADLPPLTRRGTFEDGSGVADREDGRVIFHAPPQAETLQGAHTPFNVVRFFGCQIRESTLYLVTDFCENNLRTYWESRGSTGAATRSPNASPEPGAPRTAAGALVSEPRPCADFLSSPLRGRGMGPAEGRPTSCWCTQKEIFREFVWRILHKILHGLACLHAYGIVHRNLKPENILVRPCLRLARASRSQGETHSASPTKMNVSDGVDEDDEMDWILPSVEVELSDFGFSRLLEETQGAYTPENPKDRERSYRESRRLFYRAPELLLLRGDGTFDWSPVYSFGVDIWSVAVIFMELALLRPPFRADSEMIYLLQIFRLLGTPIDARTWVEMCGLPFPEPAPAAFSGARHALGAPRSRGDKPRSSSVSFASQTRSSGSRRRLGLRQTLMHRADLAALHPSRPLYARPCPSACGSEDRSIPSLHSGSAAEDDAGRLNARPSSAPPAESSAPPLVAVSGAPPPLVPPCASEARRGEPMPHRRLDCPQAREVVLQPRGEECLSTTAGAEPAAEAEAEGGNGDEANAEARRWPPQRQPRAREVFAYEHRQRSERADSDEAGGPRTTRCEKLQRACRRGDHSDLGTTRYIRVGCEEERDERVHEDWRAVLPISSLEAAMLQGGTGAGHRAEGASRASPSFRVQLFLPDRARSTSAWALPSVPPCLTGAANHRGSLQTSRDEESQHSPWLAAHARAHETLDETSQEGLGDSAETARLLKEAEDWVRLLPLWRPVDWAGIMQQLQREEAEKAAKEILGLGNGGTAETAEDCNRSGETAKGLAVSEEARNNQETLEVAEAAARERRAEFEEFGAGQDETASGSRRRSNRPDAAGETACRSHLGLHALRGEKKDACPGVPKSSPVERKTGCELLFPAMDDPRSMCGGRRDEEMRHRHDRQSEAKPSAAYDFKHTEGASSPSAGCCAVFPPICFSSSSAFARSVASTYHSSASSKEATELILQFGRVMGSEAVALLKAMLQLKGQERISAAAAYDRVSVILERARLHRLARKENEKLPPRVPRQRPALCVDALSSPAAPASAALREENPVPWEQEQNSAGNASSAPAAEGNAAHAAQPKDAALAHVSAKQTRSTTASEGVEGSVVEPQRHRVLEREAEGGAETRRLKFALASRQAHWVRVSTMATEGGSEKNERERKLSDATLEAPSGGEACGSTKRGGIKFRERGEKRQEAGEPTRASPVTEGEPDLIDQSRKEGGNAFAGASRERERTRENQNRGTTEGWLPGGEESLDVRGDGEASEASQNPTDLNPGFLQMRANTTSREQLPEATHNQRADIGHPEEEERQRRVAHALGIAERMPDDGRCEGARVRSLPHPAHALTWHSPASAPVSASLLSSDPRFSSLLLRLHRLAASTKDLPVETCMRRLAAQAADRFLQMPPRGLTPDEGRNRDREAPRAARQRGPNQDEERRKRSDIRSIQREQIEEAVLESLETLRQKCVDLFFRLQNEFELKDSTVHLAASLFHRYFCWVLAPSFLSERTRVEANAGQRRDSHRAPASSPRQVAPPSSGALRCARGSFGGSSAVRSASGSSAASVSPSDVLAVSLRSASSAVESAACSSGPPSASVASPRGLSGARNYPPLSAARPRVGALLLRPFGSPSSASLTTSLAPAAGDEARETAGFAPEIVLSCCAVRESLCAAAACVKIADVANERSLEYYKTTNAHDYAVNVNDLIATRYLREPCLPCLLRRQLTRTAEEFPRPREVAGLHARQEKPDERRGGGDERGEEDKAGGEGARASSHAGRARLQSTQRLCAEARDAGETRNSKQREGSIRRNSEEEVEGHTEGKVAALGPVESDQSFSAATQMNFGPPPVSAATASLRAVSGCNSALCFLSVPGFSPLEPGASSTSLSGSAQGRRGYAHPAAACATTSLPSSSVSTRLLARAVSTNSSPLSAVPAAPAQSGSDSTFHCSDFFPPSSSCLKGCSSVSCSASSASAASASLEAASTRAFHSSPAVGRSLSSGPRLASGSEDTATSLSCLPSPSAPAAPDCSPSASQSAGALPSSAPLGSLASAACAWETQASREELVALEKRILQAVQFRLSTPNSLWCLALLWDVTALSLQREREREGLLRLRAFAAAHAAGAQRKREAVHGIFEAPVSKKQRPQKSGDSGDFTTLVQSPAEAGDGTPADHGGTEGGKQKLRVLHNEVSAHASHRMKEVAEDRAAPASPCSVSVGSPERLTVMPGQRCDAARVASWDMRRELPSIPCETQQRANPRRRDCLWSSDEEKPSGCGSARLSAASRAVVDAFSLSLSSFSSSSLPQAQDAEPFSCFSCPGRASSAGPAASVASATHSGMSVVSSASSALCLNASGCVAPSVSAPFGSHSSQSSSAIPPWASSACPSSSSPPGGLARGSLSPRGAPPSCPRSAASSALRWSRCSRSWLSPPRLAACSRTAASPSPRAASSSARLSTVLQRSPSAGLASSAAGLLARPSLRLPSARTLRQCRRYASLLAALALYDLRLVSCAPLLLAQLLHFAALGTFLPELFWPSFTPSPRRREASQPSQIQSPGRPTLDDRRRTGLLPRGAATAQLEESVSVQLLQNDRMHGRCRALGNARNGALCPVRPLCTSAASPSAGASASPAACARHASQASLYSKASSVPLLQNRAPCDSLEGAFSLCPSLRSVTAPSSGSPGSALAAARLSTSRSALHPCASALPSSLVGASRLGASMCAAPHSECSLAALLGPLSLPVTRRLLAGGARRPWEILQLAEAVRQLPHITRARQELRQSPLFGSASANLSNAPAGAPLAFLRFAEYTHARRIKQLEVWERQARRRSMLERLQVEVDSARKKQPLDQRGPEANRSSTEAEDMPRCEKSPTSNILQKAWSHGSERTIDAELEMQWDKGEEGDEVAVRVPTMHPGLQAGKPHEAKGGLVLQADRREETKTSEAAERHKRKSECGDSTPDAACKIARYTSTQGAEYCRSENSMRGALTDTTTAHEAKDSMTETKPEDRSYYRQTSKYTERCEAHSKAHGGDEGGGRRTEVGLSSRKAATGAQMRSANAEWRSPPQNRVQGTCERRQHGNRNDPLLATAPVRELGRAGSETHDSAQRGGEEQRSAPLEASHVSSHSAGDTRTTRETPAEATSPPASLRRRQGRLPAAVLALLLADADSIDALFALAAE
ncbi:hypothetical protein BESB_016990 [Besnoitia besnoiti]|uniref:Protein kinase domain-containing protein n=1 Tax=Besnoitia besnoiti TaxID=94643 RepID=A0A2A9M7W6_BESBE|nr:hypothetical protein BESB_016990 [Besnoitia besnoiti]PFH32381.1 hypothetical protein BESB_016990 [Besnoitia besnoiti]